MKKRLSILLLLLFITGITGCSKEKEIDLQQADGMPLDEYLNQVKLPKNLEVAFEAESVKDFQEIYSYDRVEFLQFDLDTVSQELMKNPVTSREIYAEGPQAIAETEQTIEYLTAYDGGTAFGQFDPKAAGGGLLYFFYPDKKIQKNNFDLFVHEYPDFCFSGSYGDIEKRGMAGYFGLDKDLSFADREEAKQSVASVAERLTLENVSFHYITAYDYDTIKVFYDWEKNFWEKQQEKSPELDLTFDNPEPQKTDEFYCLIGCQLIDGIPVNSYDIVRGDPDSPYQYSHLAFIYSDDGIIRADVSFYVKQPDQTTGKKEKIITASGALKLVQSYYEKGVLLEPYSIESLELVYTITMNEGSPTASLRPCWLARVSYPITVEATDADGNKQPINLTGYDHLYFDAVTGEYQEYSPSAKNP